LRSNFVKNSTTRALADLQPATLRLTMQLPDERVDVDSEPAGKRCLRVMPQLQKT
jgi:hypothetical protein